jgi:glycosyltransferase involved in cell wall biosynthesis
VPQHSLLIVGAFPANPSLLLGVQGGMRQSCELLLRSTLPRRVRLTTLDSTQVSVPPPGFAVRLALAARRCVRFVREFERDRPRFVMVFASGGASFVEKSLMLQYARMRGAHTLMFLRHGAFMGHCRASAVRRYVARGLLHGISVHLCQGDSWRRFFVSDLRLPEECCRTIENWTVTEDLLAIGRERTYDPRAGVRFVFVGWLEAVKGIPELLEAFARLHSSSDLPATELVIAGSGSLEAYCREWVAKAGLSDRVQIAGWVTGVDKHRLLASADIFVLPSHAEGLSNAMLEAMAAGLPVIVTRVGSLPDVVRDGVHGSLLEPGDVDALTGHMRALAADRQRRELLGRAACERAAAFDVERAVAELVAVMDDLAGSVQTDSGA